jgi:hypothetical protein
VRRQLFAKVTRRLLRSVRGTRRPRQSFGDTHAALVGISSAFGSRAHVLAIFMFDSLLLVLALCVLDFGHWFMTSPIVPGYFRADASDVVIHIFAIISGGGLIGAAALITVFDLVRLYRRLTSDEASQQDSRDDGPSTPTDGLAA